MSRYQLTPDKWLTDRELSVLRDNIARLKFERDRVYFETLIQTGMRASECLNLERRDLVGPSAIHVRSLKQGLDRVITVHPDLFASILSLCDASQSGFPFHVTISWIEQLWSKIRPVPKKLHSIRHTFARALWRETKNLNTVKYALGHVNVSNTMIYVVTDAEDDLANALQSMRGAS